jgi:hypothetical protein
VDTYNGVSVLNTMISNNTIGIYCNNSSPVIDGCLIENNTIGIIGFNNSNPMIINSTLRNDNFEFSMSNSFFTALNNLFNKTKIQFFDSSSTLTVQWYLHIRVKDVNDCPIEGANVWIVDNENGTFDRDYTTGPDGYVWWIALTERIQNQSGNISFNPYQITVSYYDPVEGWLTFPNNPRNISINGTVSQISTETFTSLEAIPEFSHILFPIIAITATFVFFRKRRKLSQTQ